MKYTREQMAEWPIGQPARDKYGTIWVKVAEGELTSYGEPRHRYPANTHATDMDLTLIELEQTEAAG